MKVLYSILFFVFTCSGVLAQKSKADDILGFWLTDDGRAKIEVYKESGEYSGKIIWLSEPEDENGNPPLDGNNPSPELRNKPILGLKLLKGFVFDGGKWEDGEIYDPDNGKTYDCVIKLQRDRLEVRGYVGVSLFGRTVVWTRTKA